MDTRLNVTNKDGVSERAKLKLYEKRFKKKAKLLEQERNIDKSNIAPMIDLFYDYSLQREQSEHIQPLDPVRIKAHTELSGRRLSEWEYNVLIEMDLVYRATYTDCKYGKSKGT